MNKVNFTSGVLSGLNISKRLYYRGEQETLSLLTISPVNTGTRMHVCTCAHTCTQVSISGKGIISTHLFEDP